MTDEAQPPEGHEPGKVKGTQRGGGRKNVITNSPHRNDYENLLVAGWNSFALERYAAWRYGEDIPASTFRDYRGRKKITSKIVPTDTLIDPDRMVDVIGDRTALVQLQMARLRAEVVREQAAGKLNPAIRHEVSVLNDVIESAKNDLQDIGLMPRLGEVLEVRRTGSAAAPTTDAPRAETLGEALGLTGRGQEVDSARILHLALREKNTASG